MIKGGNNVHRTASTFCFSFFQRTRTKKDLVFKSKEESSPFSCTLTAGGFLILFKALTRKRRGQGENVDVKQLILVEKMSKSQTLAYLYIYKYIDLLRRIIDKSTVFCFLGGAISFDLNFLTFWQMLRLQRTVFFLLWHLFILSFIVTDDDVLKESAGRSIKPLSLYTIFHGKRQLANFRVCFLGHFPSFSQVTTFS